MTPGRRHAGLNSAPPLAYAVRVPIDLYIHIGLPKTGTTALQQFLSTNYERLVERRILYPKSLRRTASLDCANAHTSVAFSFGACGYSEQERRHWKTWKPIDQADVDAFHRELSSHAIDTCILSCENLSCQKDIRKELGELRSFLSSLADFHIRIVLYLRRQDLLLESVNLQHITGRQQRTEISRQYHLFDFVALTDMYADVFGAGNLLVRPYERGQLRNGSVIDDFMDIVGVREIGDMQLPGRDQIRERLPLAATEVVRLANAYLRAEEQGRLVSRLRALSNEEAGAAQRWHLLGPEERRRIVRDNDAINARIAREYLGREDGRLFYDSPEETDDASLPSQLGAADLVAVLSSLVVAVDKRCDELQRTINRLNKRLARLEHPGDEAGPPDAVRPLRGRR